VNPWLIIAGILLLGAVLFYLQRRKKANQLPSHHIIQQDGFPDVHIPVALTRLDAENFALSLLTAFTGSWAAFKEIYGVDIGSLPIAIVGCVMDEIEASHPGVKWNAPTDKILLRVQPLAPYWFVRECHNVFRYMLYGMDGIYVTLNIDDLNKAQQVEDWIDKWQKTPCLL